MFAPELQFESVSDRHFPLCDAAFASLSVDGGQLVALNDVAQAGVAGWMLSIAGLVCGLADQAPEPYVSHTPGGIGRCTEPADANVW